MHREILTRGQVDLLPLAKSFSKNFGLVGGTAIALIIGHRQSVDFDLFTYTEFENSKIRKKVSTFIPIERILRDEDGQYTIIVNSISFTFFHYPFKIDFSENFDDIIKLPNLLTLAAMKAYALGRRAKWKDYVDLYVIMKNFHAIGEIIKKAKEIFGNELNEKTFRVQLSYFGDIDYSEKIIYLKGYEVDDEIIKKELTNASLT